MRVTGTKLTQAMQPASEHISTQNVKILTFVHTITMKSRMASRSTARHAIILQCPLGRVDFSARTKRILPPPEMSSHVTYIPSSMTKRLKPVCAEFSTTSKYRLDQR